MPAVSKAELIEGIVYMPSPVRVPQHGTPHYNCIVWLGLYSIPTPCIIGADNSTIRMDTDNEPQPDAVLFIDPSCGGQAKIDADGYLAGAPELVLEVAASTASYDLHEKLAAYRRNSVREYVVWRVEDREIDWRILRDGVYESLPSDAAGLLHSDVLPGLTLDPQAMITGDMGAVAKTQQSALNSPEHAAFIAQLG
jgi:Uma2 family endonuclease